MAELRLLFLGAPRVKRDGVAIDLGRRKALGLLAYLAVSRQTHSRDSLAALLWPDMADARGQLRRTLSSLNRTLGHGWLSTSRETVGLAAGTSLWVDTEHFMGLLARGHEQEQPTLDWVPARLLALAEAVELYRADFLDGFSLRDSPGFDEWQLLQAERLRGGLASALERLVWEHHQRGELERARSYAQRWLALDSLNEAAHRSLMRLYAQEGQRGAALRQYQECVRVLQRELGIEPLAETTALYADIRDGALGIPVADQLPAAELQVGASPSALPPASQLPIQPTPSIGRARELAEIARLLALPDCRLLTLVGMGGMGKTHLAIEAATASARYGVASYFVSLTTITVLDRALAAVAAALGLQLHSRAAPQQQLVDYLREKTLLLVLDNLEQLGPAGAALADLLLQAPQVTLLATSRERLGLRGEWLLPVGGLAVPTTTPAPDPTGFSAGQLFLQCARRTKPGFVPGQADRPAIARICTLVGGMPLAIELAAAWVPLLDCSEIGQEIARSLDLLASDMRDVPERHRNMRAMFATSWEYLNPQERQALCGLAIFQGGFGRAAAEWVSGATLPLLRALLSRALLQRDEAGRFHMHELLRQYAAERLDTTPQERQALAARHCHYYAALLEQVANGGSQQRDPQQLTSESDNIRTAWHWAIAHQQHALCRQMLPGLYRFYEARGWYQEVASLFGAALAQLSEAGTGAEELQGLAAQLRARRGAISCEIGNYVQARGDLLAALATFRQQQQQAEIAFALGALGLAAHDTGAYAEASAYLHESLQIANALGDRYHRAETLHTLGKVADAQGHYDEARRHYMASLAAREAIGDEAGMALSYNRLGVIGYKLGNYEQARQYYQNSRQLAERANAQRVRFQALSNLGIIAEISGDYAESASCYRLCLNGFRLIGDRVGTSGTLLNLAGLAAAQQAYSDARQHCQAALDGFHAIGHQYGIGVCYSKLGEIAELVGDASEALRCYQQGLVIQQSIGDRRNLASTLQHMGGVALGQGNSQAAKGFLLQALDHALAIQANHIALRTLIKAAALLAHTGAPSHASALLQAVLRHPECRQRIAEQASQLLAELPPASSPPAPPDLATLAAELRQRWGAP